MCVGWSLVTVFFVGALSKLEAPFCVVDAAGDDLTLARFLENQANCVQCFDLRALCVVLLR